MPNQKVLLGSNLLKALAPEFGVLVNYTLYSNDVPLGSADSRDTIVNKTTDPVNNTSKNTTNVVAKTTPVADPKVPMEKTGLPTVALALIVGLASMGLINYRKE